MSVAAVNGPLATVLSGDEEAVTAVAAELAGRGRKTHRLQVGHAFHSHHMDDMLDEFAAHTALRRPRRPRPVRGLHRHRTPRHRRRADGRRLLGRPGARRRPLPRGHRTLEEQVVTTYVEIGPGGVLTALARTALRRRRRPPRVPAAAQRADPKSHSLTAALAAAHTHGAPVELEALLAPTRPTRRADLPTYPFTGRRYWLEPPRRRQSPPHGPGSPPATRCSARRRRSPTTTGVLLTGRRPRERQPWLADHAVAGTRPASPAPRSSNSACGPATRSAPSPGRTSPSSPARAPGAGSVQLQVAVAAPDGTAAAARSPCTPGPTPTTTAPGPGTPTAALAPAPAAPGAGRARAWPPADARSVPLDGLYDALAVQGFQYGPAFQGLRAAWRSRRRSVYAEVTLRGGPAPRRRPLRPAPGAAGRRPARPAPGAGRRQRRGDGDGTAWACRSRSAASPCTPSAPPALRVRLERGPSGAVSLHLADGDGTPGRHRRLARAPPRSPGRAVTPPGRDGALYAVRWSDTAGIGPAPVADGLRLAGDDRRRPPVTRRPALGAAVDAPAAVVLACVPAPARPRRASPRRAS